METKRKRSLTAILLLMAVSVFVSCQKDDDEPQAQNTSTTPAFEGTAGTLWAVRTVTTIDMGGIGIGGGDYTIEVGTGVGVFWDGGKNVNVGTVKVNGETMSNNSNYYMTTVSQTQPTGLDFSGGIQWEVSGGSGFSAFTHTVTNAFPVASGFTAGETLTSGENYTISFTNVTGADSIIFVVNDVAKSVSGKTKSYTFTSAQLSALKKGAGVVQAAPYNYKIVNYGGKDIVFGNELAYSKNITIK